jgi:phage tail-like protein
MAQQTDPFRGFRFRIEIGGLQVAAFSEASLPDITVETVAYREGTDSTSRRTLSGLTAFGNVTLSKGLTSSVDLYQWHQIVVQKGSSAANACRNATITLLDLEGNVAAQWTLVNALPIRYQISGLNASSSDVVIESIEFAVDSMKRVK